MAPSSMSRYRSAVLILAGVSAAYAVYLIRNIYLGLDSPPQTRLRRSNAVRHPRRRQRPDPVETTVATDHAISHLLERIANGSGYGTISLSQLVNDAETSSNPTWHLLPSVLPTVDDLQSVATITEGHARQIRGEIHRMFVRSFLAEEYPPLFELHPSDVALLSQKLVEVGIDAVIVEQSFAELSPEEFGPGNSWPGPVAVPLFSTDGLGDDYAVRQALEDEGTVADDQSHESYHSHNNPPREDDDEQNVLKLVYLISEQQAKRDAYVHRNVQCNGCRAQPILGIRYSCANCSDYDLCEDCEASNIHIKTHVFYKIRIPAALGYHRPTAPTWYPGRPHSLPRSLPNSLTERLVKETTFEKVEIEALWEQFTCIAGRPWPKDPNDLGMGIDRDIFAKRFGPPTSLSLPPPNLIFERIFAFYDTNNDGVVGFEEFVKGIADLQDKTRDTRLRRIFRAYDMDNDGFVDRKDFLRIFRAYYSWSREMARASIAALESETNDLEDRANQRDDHRSIIEGSRPISSAFDSSSLPNARNSRVGFGKALDVNGDLDIVDDKGVLEEDSDDVGDRNKVIGDAAVANHARRILSIPSMSDNSVHDVDFQEVAEEQPGHEANLTMSSVHNGLQVNDHADNGDSIRNRAIQERWRRRGFYTDIEEGASAPSGYVELDSSDEEGDDADELISPESASDSKRQSLRSRSSSKVRFKEDVTDTDYETRSNTSSRSIPVGERWGGFEIREAEKDIGKEVLFQAIQEGFNQLLDQLFKHKENLAMASASTRTARQRWAERTKEGEASIDGAPDTKAQQGRSNSRTCSPQDTEPQENETENLESSHLSSEIPDPDSATSISEADPTLPQHRPNTPPLPDSNAAEGSFTSFPGTPRSIRLAALHASSPRSSPRKTFLPLSRHLTKPRPRPISDDSPPPEILVVWQLHDAADAEAKKRGGHGKLDFDEFAAGMVGEGYGTEQEGENDGNSGGLGKLEFIGSWLEHASF